MSLTINIQIRKNFEAPISLLAQRNYQIVYQKGGKKIGTLGLQVDTIKVNFRKHYLINVGEMKVPEGIDKARLMFRTKRSICRYFWRIILTSKVYIWSDATVCEMDFSDPLPTKRQELTFSKTFQSILAYISERYYDEPRDWSAKRKAEVMYMRHDLVKAIPLFVAANPLHRDGVGLINFGQLSSLDLLV